VKDQIYDIDKSLPARIDSQNLAKAMTYSKGYVSNLIQSIDLSFWLNLSWTILYWISFIFVTTKRLVQKKE
jgi:hypothetical protein